MGDNVKRINAILLYCESIDEKMNRFGRDIDDFIGDPDYQHSCSFCISQIGENIKFLPSEITEKYPDVHWKGIAGLRDVISHGYHKIDLETLWAFIVEEIPALRVACESIIRELGP